VATLPRDIGAAPLALLVVVPLGYLTLSALWLVRAVAAATLHRLH
jgi:hypothetical protein